MKLQKSMPSLLSEGAMKRPGSGARLRPKINNFAAEPVQDETPEEIYKRLRRIYSKGMLHLKNYHVDEGLRLLKDYIQRLATEIGREHEYFKRDFSAMLQSVGNYALRVQQENNDAEMAVVILIWAEELTKPHNKFEETPVQRCQIFNNLGCVYRRCGKLQLALNSLEKALELVTLNDLPSKSITLLNVTAVLSQMGIHDKALEYAQQALRECQTELTLFLRDQSVAEDDSQYTERLRCVGIAMYNLAIEEESCDEIDQAYQNFQRAFRFTSKHFGDEDPITLKCQAGLGKCKQRIDQQLKESRAKIKQQLRPTSGRKLSQTIQQIGPKSAKSFYFRPPNMQSPQLQTKSQGNLFNIKVVKPPVQKPAQEPAKFIPNEPQVQEPENKLAEMTELRNLGVLDWSDSDHEIQDQEEKSVEVPDIVPPTPLPVNEPEHHVEIKLNETEQKESRLSFLKKMTLFEAEDTLKKKYQQQLEQERQKQAEQESLMNQQDQQRNQELQQQTDHLRVVKVQSYLKMKIQRRKYLRQQEERKKQAKRDNYMRQILKIQSWMRKWVFRQRMLRATRLLIKESKCKRFPMREMEAVLRIQKNVKLFLTYVSQREKRRLRAQKGFVILRTSQFEPTFWDDEGKSLVHKQLYNRQFWFRLSITKPHRHIRICVSPYEKRKCMKTLQRGFERLITVQQFYRTLALLDQYVEHLKTQIDEDIFLTRNFETIHEIGQHFIQKVVTAQNVLEHRLIISEEVAIEEHLKRLAPLLESILRIKENQRLIILGFDDYRYDNMIQVLEDDHKPMTLPFYAEKVSMRKLQLIISIQRKIRGFLWRVKARLILRKKTTTSKYFTVRCLSDSGPQYIRVFIQQHKVTLKKVIYCRIESTKRRTNELQLFESITKQLGEPSFETFFEIYRINFKDSQLELTEEGQYWITRELEKQKKKGNKGGLRLRDAAATKIQRAIRRHIFTQTLRVMVEHRMRKEKESKGHMHEQSLVRKVMIYGERPHKRAFYMNFILQTEHVQVHAEDSDRSRAMSFMNSIHTSNDQIKQSIVIYTKTLEHQYSRELVQPFQQLLFYYVDPTEILGIAYKMLEIAKVEKGKANMLRLDVKNLEEVQGMIINQQKRTFDGGQPSKKDETLEARRIFNSNTQRTKWLFKNTNSFEFIPENQNKQVIMKRIDTDHLKDTDNYFKQILKSYNIYRYGRDTKISDSKAVTPYDAQSISNYVRTFAYQSENGFGADDQNVGRLNLNFLEEILLEETRYQQEMEEQIERERRDADYRQQAEQEKFLLIQRSQMVLWSDYCVISNSRVYLKVVYNKLLGQLFIRAARESTHDADHQDSDAQQVEEINILMENLLPGGRVVEEFMKTHIEQLIIKQLQIEDDGLYFMPDPTASQTLVQEQLIWEQYQLEMEKAALNQLNSSSLEDLKAILSNNNNISKTSYQTLREMNKQVVQLAFIEHEEKWEHEYLFNLTDNQILITIYLKNDLKVRSLHIIPAHELECPYLVKSIRSKTPEEIQHFLKDTITAMEGYLLVEVAVNEKKQRYAHCNFHQFQHFLPMIIKEQFLRKLQYKIKVTQVFRYVSLYRSNKNSLVFLGRQIRNYEGRYVEYIFFLSKGEFQLKFMMREMNQVDGNGTIVPHYRKPAVDHGSTIPVKFSEYSFNVNLLELQERQVMENLWNSLSESQMIHFVRVNPEKWIELDIHRNPQYYRKMFKPLMDLIVNGARVKYPTTTLMRVNFEYLPIPIHRQIEQPQESTHGIETNFYMLINAVMRLQNGFKRMKQREWFQLKSEKKAQLEVKARQVGNHVKRGIRMIGKRLFIVNVYRRPEGLTGQQMLTFDLVPYTNQKIDRRNIKLRCRGFYLWDPTLLLNIGSLNLYDYLINQIYIDQSMVKFKVSDFHSVTEVQKLGVDQTLNPYVGRGTMRLSTMAIQEPKPASFMDQLIGPEKLVNHSHALNSTVDDEDIPETIYNVIYTGKNTIKAKSADIQENTVQIEVNLDNVRKLYPTLDTFDGDVMKAIGQQLIEGIRINRQGELLVDQRKINPTFITVRNNTLTKNAPDGKPAIKQAPQAASTTQILVKKSTYYQHVKYLIVIYYMERKIAKILKQAVDQVFEEYEVLYQVVANNLTNKELEPITWEISPEEAQILSHHTDKAEIAHAMVKRILVINDKFIYLTESRSDLQKLKTTYPNVILFLEKGIRPIQHRFRNRKFIHNYKLYRNVITQWKDSSRQFLPQVALHSLESLRSQLNFVVLCGEDRSKHIVFYAWDIQTYNRYYIELPKSKYQNLIMNDKHAAMRVLASCVEFSADLGELIFAPPAMETIVDRFKQEAGKSKKQLETQTPMTQEND